MLAPDEPTASRQVATASETLAQDNPLSGVETLIAQGGADNLNAALAALIAFARDETKTAKDRAQAAVMVARMYDPETHDLSRSPMPTPNIAAARRYYQQAADLDATDAVVEALARLASTP
jgi:serine/threonine-protein kinase